MSILKRFKDIMSSNMNALLDKAEDPEKMIDQYLRNLNKDLGAVKAETASIMAEEKRSQREVIDCEKNIEKMQNYAVKALEADDEKDARTFLTRKKDLEKKLIELQKSHALAEANTVQMRQMHDKLVSDIEELNQRQAMLKGKASVAKTQARMNELGSSLGGANSSISAFDAMEEKINKSLDEAEAMAELNKQNSNDIDDLTAKYDNQPKSEVEDELAALKAQLGKE